MKYAAHIWLISALLLLFGLMTFADSVEQWEPRVHHHVGACPDLIKDCVWSDCEFVSTEIYRQKVEWRLLDKWKTK